QRRLNGVAAAPRYPALAILSRGGGDPGIPSPAEAALPHRVRAQRPQEIHSEEIGPECLAEVEFAVRALPEEEPAKTLLAGGPDHGVGIWLPPGGHVHGAA